MWNARTAGKCGRGCVVASVIEMVLHQMVSVYRINGDATTLKE